MSSAVAAATAWRRHRWSDWIGLLCYLASAVGLYRGSPSLWAFMLPSIAHEVLIAVAFLIRPPPVRRSSRLLPRAMGYIHTFFIVVFMQLASRWRPEWLAATTNETAKLAGTYLWLVSSVLGLWPLWYLRHSFSLEPEARSLVVAGPYRLARHPVYTVYILTLAGIWLRTLSAPFLIALLVWVALLIARVHFEEEVLIAAFPEYQEYRRRVGAFGPKLAKPRS
jgi:protein-S-isoprenylcysteine O-methyltransferase Ste14